MIQAMIAVLNQIIDQHDVDDIDFFWDENTIEVDRTKFFELLATKLVERGIGVPVQIERQTLRKEYESLLEWVGQQDEAKAVQLDSVVWALENQEKEK